MIQLGRRFTYEEIMEEIRCLCHDFSNIITAESLGKSVDGREIPMLRLGGPGKALILTAGVHGRESINPIVSLKMMERYCTAYFLGEEVEGYPVKEILSEYSICLLPLVNPDGYTIAVEGFEKIKNPYLRQQAIMHEIRKEEWKANGRGIDVNRNFPSESYVPLKPDDTAGSERETKALMEVFGRIPSIAYMDLHSRGKVIYFYRKAMTEDYNRQQEALAGRMQKICQYDLGTKEEEMMTSTSGGNTVHYYSEQYGLPAITVETCPDEADFPLDPCYQAETFEEIFALPLCMLADGENIMRFEKKKQI